MSSCPFQIFGLTKTATEAEVLRQWRKMSLEHHPDKNSDQHASTLLTMRLNASKDRCITACRQREERLRIKSEVREQLLELKLFMIAELQEEHPASREVHSQMKKLVSACMQAPYCHNKPSPELGAFWRMIQNLNSKVAFWTDISNEQQDQIKDLERRLQQSEQRAAEQQRLLAELQATHTETQDIVAESAAAFAALKREMENAELHIQIMMSRQREEFAKHEAVMREHFIQRESTIREQLKSEFDAGLSLADTCAERLHAIIAQLADAQAAHVHAAQQQIAQLQGQMSESNPHIKRHKSNGKNENDNLSELKRALGMFIHEHIIATENSEISTKKIMDAFISHGHHIFNEAAFWHELSNQLKAAFPNIKSKRTKYARGYLGISIC